jgi:hypothetical protein
VRVIAEEFNMNRETVRQIVKEDLGMGKISAKISRARSLTRLLSRPSFIENSGILHTGEANCDRRFKRIST